MKKPTVVVVDFDGAFTLQTRDALCSEGGRARIVLDEQLSRQSVMRNNPDAVVLTASRLGQEHSLDPSIFTIDVPFLGICNGAQLIARAFGGSVGRLESHEDGPVELRRRSTASLLLAGTPRNQQVFMHHECSIGALPPQFRVTGETAMSHVAAFESFGHPPLIGVQFHPESAQTIYGAVHLRRFLLLARTYRPVRGIRRVGPN